MFLYLSKLLPPLVYPLGLACLLIVAAILLVRHPGWQRAALVLAVLLLFLGGNRWLSAWLTRSLEWRYLPPEELPQAEAIVVLGGGTYAADYPRPTVEVSGAGDRVLYAGWLYRQGAADHILLSGGRLEWSPEGESPAEDMARILEWMDVPEQALWLESDSRNTYENAVYSRAILEEKGIRRIILVTSALHMPRSVGLFEKQGLEVIPAPADYNITQAVWQDLLHANLATKILYLLPSAGDLNQTTGALKEYLGIFIYGMRGWL